MANPICKCSDPNCPKCKGKCANKAVTVVIRIDMDDRTGTPVCRACADDCLDAGIFRDEPWKMRHHKV